jgi:Inner membrane protein YgaP-like, transmembrane domain
MDDAPLCNIGGKQRRLRLIVGVPVLLVGFIGSLFNDNFFWQAVAFFGFLSIFQAQAGTCVFLAAAGARNMDYGKEAVSDPEQLSFFQRQSRTIYMRSFMATLVLILIAQRQAVLNIIHSLRS